MYIIDCPAEKNLCWLAGRHITPRGVMWHSTGANNPNLWRYAQPCPNHPQRKEVLSQLGDNLWENDWCNNPTDNGTKRCVHALIGKLRNGSVGVVQTLPWNHRGWHAGGAANNTHIGFEICEDNLQNDEYFREVYRAGVWLSAYLCDMFQLDPLAPGVIICHAEGHKMGVASNHADVLHWFRRYGVTMDDVRKDVYNMLNLSEERVREIIREELIAVKSQPSPSLEKEWEKAKSMGVTDGTRPGGFATREQVAAMIVRATTK